ncbi:MAG: hypothetical protein J2P17_26845 [Mycobacterium sp.]|nr:hypothetical protein [Mycobacterium sp.]
MDDRGQRLAQFRGDEQQAFLVQLRRGDLQQRDNLASGGQFVGDEAVRRRRLKTDPLRTDGF